MEPMRLPMTLSAPMRFGKNERVARTLPSCAPPTSALRRGHRLPRTATPACQFGSPDGLVGEMEDAQASRSQVELSTHGCPVRALVERSTTRRTELTPRDYSSATARHPID
jgi:hypothetical protein